MNESIEKLRQLFEEDFAAITDMETLESPCETNILPGKAG